MRQQDRQGVQTTHPQTVHQNMYKDGSLSLTLECHSHVDPAITAESDQCKLNSLFVFTLLISKPKGDPTTIKNCKLSTHAVIIYDGGFGAIMRVSLLSEPKVTHFVYLVWFP